MTLNICVLFFSCFCFVLNLLTIKWHVCLKNLYVRFSITNFSSTVQYCVCSKVFIDMLGYFCNHVLQKCARLSIENSALKMNFIFSNYSNEMFYWFSSDSQSHSLLFCVIQPFALSSMTRDSVCCKRRSMRKPWTSSQLWKQWVHLVIIPLTTTECTAGEHTCGDLWDTDTDSYSSSGSPQLRSVWMAASDAVIQAGWLTGPPCIMHRQEMISGGSQRSHRAVGSRTNRRL